MKLVTICRLAATYRTDLSSLNDNTNKYTVHTMLSPFYNNLYKADGAKEKKYHDASNSLQNIALLRLLRYKISPFKIAHVIYTLLHENIS
jgi:hypothetical protein